MTVVEAAAPDAAGGNLEPVAEKPPRARRRWLPKFVLALPSWFWYLSFFVVPLVLVIINSFGAKVKGSAGRVDLSNPSLDRYRDALNGTYFDVPDIALSEPSLQRRPGASAVAGRAPRPCDHPVLDQFPRQDSGLAHHAGPERFPLELPAEQQLARLDVIFDDKGGVGQSGFQYGQNVFKARPIW